MSDYRYIPIPQHDRGSNALLHVEVVLDDDSRWHAWVAGLPECAAWGYARDAVVEAVQHAAYVYLAMLLAKGMRVPPDVETIDALLV